MTKIENNTGFRLTSREVLVIIAGPEHATHLISVAATLKRSPHEHSTIVPRRWR